jgi:hypothetical protein
MRSVSADFCAEAGTAPAPIAAISITPPKVLRIVTTSLSRAQQ